MVTFLRILSVAWLLFVVNDGAIVKQTLFIDQIKLALHSGKSVISANYSLPGPSIEAFLGDTLIIRVVNRLKQPTTVHWHGLRQINTPHMDGAVGATQCAIPAHGELTYEFIADTAGTAWYHGDLFEQYTDGLYGPLIIRRRNEPYQDQYTTERILVVADWYNYEANGKLTNWYMSTANPEGIEPIPDAIIVNGRFSQSLSIAVKSASKIRFRVINAASFSMYKFSIDGLPLHIIELDQQDVVPYNVSSFIVNVGQRVSFCIDLKQLDPLYGPSGPQNSSSIFIRFEAMLDMYPVDALSYIAPYATARYAYPTFLNPTYLAVLSLDSKNSMPTYEARDTTPVSSNAIVSTDANLLDARPIYSSKDVIPRATHYLELNVEFSLDAQGINRGYFNNVTYNMTKDCSRTVSKLIIGIQAELNNPVLHQMVARPYALGISAPLVKSGSALPVIQSDGCGHYLVPYQAVVDVFINNTDQGEHPFHMHGYSFWIISTSDNPDAETLYRDAYIRRDVVSVPGGGWAKIRFVADHAGAWMFHCHIEWHIVAGLMLTFVVAPDQLAAQGFKIPSNHQNLCFSGKAFAHDHRS